MKSPFPYKILLASKSPRRKYLLELAAIDFRIDTRDVEENYPAEMAAEDVPEFLALKKGRALIEARKSDELILAADTIVELDGQIFGKPKDAEDALQTLRQLSGKTHRVITGCALYSENETQSFSEVTEVQFRSLTEEQMKYYVEKDKPFDKAGSYAIQGFLGATGIAAIKGCYFNVMGLPVSRLLLELAQQAKG